MKKMIKVEAFHNRTGKIHTFYNINEEYDEEVRKELVSVIAQSYSNKEYGGQITIGGTTLSIKDYSYITVKLLDADE